ncbi:hypothetical protein B5807_09761 [Epicoccum nigrum]|uniref:Uncharacterized protein n=1 Tax=Epicoccum nigrum TaxID=105696 RepID=A0A1Y2LP46_EPING|nr:hypothetical protein B5807_09761 [Epicoccum nigrum]
MEFTGKPTESQSGTGSLWQDRAAIDEFEFASEMRDTMKQDSPTLQIADSNRDVSVNAYISTPPSNLTGDHEDAGDAVRVEEDPSVQLGKEKDGERGMWETPVDAALDDRHEERSIAEDILVNHPSLKRPPITRNGSSFTRPTKASMGWQTQKLQSDTNEQPIWRPAGRLGSVGSSRPGSAHSNSTGRSNDYVGGRHSPQYRSPKRLQIVPNDQVSQGKSQRSSQLLANTTIITEERYETASLGNKLLKAIPEDAIEAAVASSDALNDLRHSVSTWADQHHSSLDREVWNMGSDLDHFCIAWIKACAAAEISCEALDAFHFLVTKSEVDEASRSSAHQELEMNKLANWISETQERINRLERQCKEKDDMLEIIQAEIISAQIVSAEDSAPQLQSQQHCKAQGKQRKLSKETPVSDKAEQQLDGTGLGSKGHPTNTSESPSPLASPSSANPTHRSLKPIFLFPTSPLQAPSRHPAPPKADPESILALREKLRLEREEQAAITALKDKVRRLRIESIGLPPSVRSRLKEREGEREKNRYGEEPTWFERWRGYEDAVWGQLSGEERRKVGDLG